MNASFKWWRATVEGVVPVYVNRVSKTYIWVSSVNGEIKRRRQTKAGRFYVQSQTLANQIYRTLRSQLEAKREAEEMERLLQRSREMQDEC